LALTPAVLRGQVAPQDGVVPLGLEREWLIKVLVAQVRRVRQEDHSHLPSPRHQRQRAMRAISSAARTYSFRDQVSLDLRVSAKLARQGRRRRIETKRFLDDRLEILELLQAVSERVCEVE